jgi:hypothetical protein
MSKDISPPIIRRKPVAENGGDEAGREPAFDLVWNVYQENGDTKSMVLNISFHLPAPACCCSHTTMHPNGA